MNKTIDALVSIGFTQESAEKQIKELNDIILSLVAKRVADENPDIELSVNNYGSVVKEKYAAGKYEQLLTEISSNVVSDYFEAVTKNLVPLKRDEFYRKVKEDSQQIN